MPGGSVVRSGIASPVTSSVEVCIEFPISNPSIAVGLRSVKASKNLRVIVTGGAGFASLALMKRKLEPNGTSKVSGEVSRIVVGRVAVIDTESSVRLEVDPDCETAGAIF
jgi:hypothetical protein